MPRTVARPRLRAVTSERSANAASFEETFRLLESEVRRRRRAEAALEAVTRTLPTSAFFLFADGRVEAANEQGAVALRTDRELVEAVRRASDPVHADPSFTVVPIVLDGNVDCHLVSRRNRAAEFARRLERATHLWQLTSRQSEVLGLGAQGLSNKEIAVRLSCADNTVEAHLSAIFRKAGCDGRTALISKFWSAV